jgi:hypothetical protein
MSITLPYAVPANLDQWAADVEAEGGYSSAETPALVAWGEAEGGSFNNPDYGNVLGTTLGEPGSKATNSAGVQNYAASGQTQAQAWQEGLAATISMFHQSNMSAINTALESGDPNELPTALGQDPWGTSPSSVASILGEDPDQIAALGNATGNNSQTTGSGSQINAQDASLSSALGGTALQFFGLQQGSHFLVRGAFAIVGIILIVIALKEMFSDNGATDIALQLPRSAYNVGAKGAKKGADAAAAAGAVAAA